MAADWRKLKMAYVTGTESYRALAKRCGVSASTLSKVATKEGWPKARAAYGDKVAAQTAEAMCARASAREVDRLEKLRVAADGVADRMAELIADEEQFFRHIVTKGTGEDAEAAERVFKKADVRALKDFSAALQTMTRTMRDLWGMPTLVEKSAMDLAAERLKFDLEKAGLGEKDVAETGVLMLPPMKTPQVGAVKEAENQEVSSDG